LGAFGFSCKDLSDFPISFVNFSGIIPIVLQKIDLTMKKSLQAVLDLRIEFRLLVM